MICHFVIGAHKKKGIVHHGGRRELVAERIIDGRAVVVGPGKHSKSSTALFFLRILVIANITGGAFLSRN